MRRGPKAIEIYNECMRNDQDVEWAAMCALQQPPGTRYSDKAYQQAARADMESWGDKLTNGITELAQKHGINTNGKFYEGALGSYIDPDAWVSDLSDVRTVCKKKNLDMDGAIKIRGRRDDGEPVKKVRLAPDLVNELTQKKLASDPALAEKVRKNPKKIHEVKEQVIERHAPKPR